MPRRRGNVCQKAVTSVVEVLEQRMLLTTLTGGGVDPVTGEPLTATLSYKDARGNNALITIGGNTTAEFIFARVTRTNNIVIDSGPIPISNTTDPGNDLFSIYVSQADSRSFISVSETDKTTGALIPFANSAGEFKIFNAQTGLITPVTADAGTGGLLLGARTIDISPAPDEDEHPILSHSAGAIGVRPDLGRVTAGFQVAPGMDFGKFFFSGVIVGAVEIPGSIGSFYGGNIWTGDAQGVPLGLGQVISHGKRVPNFHVGGDIHSLLVSGSIGTNNDAALDQLVYVTGFEMQVGGSVGEVNARDAVVGAVNVVHGRASSEFGANVEEVEGINPLTTPAAPAAGWTAGFLEGSALVHNDSFAAPQILPSYAGRRHHSSVVVNGQLVATPRGLDYVDYYAMPLLAGQDLTVTLRPQGTVAGADLMNVGVFDPDGRLILTDYPNVSTTAVTGQPVHFTADRPGLYRIAVAVTGDGTFANAGQNIGVSPYVLTVGGGGDLPLGGIMATNQIFDAQAGGYGFYVQNGDMGALDAGGNLFSLTDQSINVRKGNLRSVQGGEVGILQNNLFGSGPNLFVTRGNVGLIRSTTGILDLNGGVLPLAIGGDYQVIDSASTTAVVLVANRGVGVIRAGDFATPNFASSITVNADLQGDDGIIDLIDCAGDFGTVASGGPQITTGPGGNVRYIHVGGNVFRDVFFGGGSLEATTYDPGQNVTLQDDSGTTMEFEPFPVVPNPLFIPGGTNPALIGPSLSIIGYGIRGSGGVAVINVTSNGSVRIGAGGRRGSKSHAEIGDLVTTGIGNPVVSTTNAGELVFSSPTGNGDTNAVNLDVLMNGSGTLDVFKIEGSDFTSIRNQTPGEIVNIDATVSPVVPPTGGTNNGTIGSLEATNIGTAVHHTAAAVNGIQTIGNTYPFNQQHNGVVSGNILNIEASGAVGNLNVAGNIGNVSANAGGRHTTGTFEGITGPIVATGFIDTVNIGDGVLPSGNGNLSRSGIYAGGVLGTVTNRGLGSDIRGDIVSSSNIGRISLSDGAMIGSRVMVVSQFGMSSRLPTPVSNPDFGDTTTSPSFEIGEISTGGQGGIIGSFIEAADIGDIAVRRGFGILNSQIVDGSDGTVNSIYAEGYGIRGCLINGGALLNSMKTAPKVRNVSTLEYSPSVRLSERFNIDPYFDQAPNDETDLHLFLGTSARRPQIKRVTDTGVIADTTATANRNAGTVVANQVRTSRFNFANSISSIKVGGVVDGLAVTTGRLKSFVSGDSFGLDFAVAGVIDSIRVVGDVDDNSRVQALGPSARIVDFIVDGTMNGDVSSANNLHQLLIGKDLGAPALVKARTLDIQRIRGDIFGTIQIG